MTLSVSGSSIRQQVGNVILIMMMMRIRLHGVSEGRLESFQWTFERLFNPRSQRYLVNRAWTLELE